ncbi:MAG: glycerate-2-kinase family protein, partial [Halobacteriales archaeon]|nr:glycerate-2-kinase family protein [Halobacteriales archaeon]
MEFANRDALLVNAAQGLEDARSDALSILARGVESVEPAMLVRRSVQREQHVLRLRGDPFAGGPGADEDLLLPMDGLGAVRCIAAGKAAEGMLRGLGKALKLDEAFAVAPAPRGVEVVRAHEASPWPVLRAGHPLPDGGSVRAGERALAMARGCAAQDLLVVLLSGGASALLESPLVPLEDLRAVEQALLQAGARIEDLNA